MIALLPIRPSYASAILEGTKKVEFRRKKFKREVKYVVIYASNPVQKIVGYFEVEGVRETTPDKAWLDYRGVGAIDEVSYMNYYAGAETAYVIRIREVVRFDRAVPLKDLSEKMKAPQSYRYLTEASFEEVKRVSGRF